MTYRVCHERRLRVLMILAAPLLLLSLVTAPVPATAATITVGYQPYDTLSWPVIVMKHREIWKKHLPPGTTIEWQSALQGSIIVNSMLAGKTQIGYTGDMPSIVSLTKRSQADIRLVSVLFMSAGQRCGQLVLPAGSAAFKSPEEALQSLNGKSVATPKGSCADRLFRAALAKGKIKPREYLNQSIEVIATNLRAKKLDAAMLWDPTASRIGDLVGDGIARTVATSVNWGENDGGFIIMRKDFLDQQPDLAKSWLKAEIEAQQFTINPQNQREVIKAISAHTDGISKKALWFSIFGRIPQAQGGSEIRAEFPLLFSPEIVAFLREGHRFLFENKSIDVPEFQPDSIIDAPLKVAVRELGVTVPLGSIKASPVDKYPGD